MNYEAMVGCRVWEFKGGVVGRVLTDGHMLSGGGSKWDNR